MTLLPVQPRFRFQYSGDAWPGIAEKVAHLPHFGRELTPYGRQHWGEEARYLDVKRRHLENAAEEFLFSPAQGRVGPKMRSAQCDAVLQSIDELEQNVVSFVQAAFAGRPLQDDVRGSIEEDLFEALGRARDLFGSLGDALRPDCHFPWGFGFAPVAAPRTAYFREVLRVWVELGGELRVSRHPLSGETRGPLWRFFIAAIEPVVGAGAISPASFPGLVADFKKVLAADASRAAEELEACRLELMGAG